MVRDISTDFLMVNHYIIDFGHRDHYWCRPYCSYVTLPFEIFNIIALSIVLKRNKVGFLGVVVLASLPFWLFAWLAP
jgi:hypothetical protein